MWLFGNMLAGTVMVPYSGRGRMLRQRQVELNIGGPVYDSTQ